MVARTDDRHASVARRALHVRVPVHRGFATVSGPGGDSRARVLQRKPTMQPTEATGARPASMRILVVYGSTHGQTARIAERIAARVRKHGAEVVVTGHPARFDVESFDAVIVGGRVHGSRYPWRVTRFIRRNRRALTARPSAFFSVSLLQLSPDPAKRAQTETLPTRRIPKLGWTPDRTEVIGGALLWKTQYGVLAWLFVRMWRRALGAVLDPIRSEQVFTDWAQVDRFADSFVGFAKARLEVNAGAKALEQPSAA